MVLDPPPSTTVAAGWPPRVFGAVNLNLTTTSQGLTNATTTPTISTTTATTMVTKAARNILGTRIIIEEDIFIDDQANMTMGPLIPSSMISPEERDSAPLGLLVILVITVIGNVMVCLAVKLDRRLHHMTYYFFVSMAVLHIMMAAAVMPPAMLIVLAGSFEYSEEWCKVWITLDLFFCNNTCLHLAFTNMDTFLRLKDPLRHGRVTTTCSIVLWLGASWMIAFVQGIAQFMLSQGDHGIIRNGVCFIADKNFVILGTLFSYLIPTVISILFYCLCIYEIKALKDGKFLDESEASQTMYRYGSNESVVDDGSEETSCVSEVIEALPREQVQLAVVTDMTCTDVKENVASPQNAANNPEETTSFCDDTQAILTESNGINQATSFADHILSTDQSTSCTLLLRDPGMEGITENDIRPNAEVDHSSPDENLRQEQAISRLMFLLLLFTLTLWVPFSASNVVYGVCTHCRRNMTFDEMSTFKWLAYSTAMLGPILYGKFCEPLREAYWKVITCFFCRKH